MSDSSDAWPVTWEENRRAQLEAVASATADQRVAWLEEALRLAAASGALERLRGEAEDAPKRR